MRTFMQDLGYGLKSLVRSPVFAGVVALTLAVGIGANTVVFSAVNGMVLNPFPFPEPDRVVGVGTAYPRVGEDLGFWENLSTHEFLDIREQSATLDDIVAWDMGFRELGVEGRSRNLFTAFWWGNPLETVQMDAWLGRGFTDEEVREGARAAMLSHRVWATAFGADSTLVGEAISVNGEPYTLVGVIPPGLTIYGTDLWTVMPVAPSYYPRDRRQFQVLARIGVDANLAAVNAELEGLARRVERAHGAELEEYAGWRVEARTWTDVNVATLRPAAVVLMGAVGFVLLLVCANVANMLLARSARRRREMAVRTAMGAGRGRLVRQLLTEAMILALVGGAVGVGLAVLGIRGVEAYMDTLSLPAPGSASLDGTVLVFTALLSAGTGLLFGVVPALQISRGDVQSTLRSEGKGATASGSRQRLQRVFVGAEVALALALLVGGGLLVRSLLALGSVESGWSAERVLTMRLTLPARRYAPAEVGPFFRQLGDRVEGLPGVERAAATTQLPGRVFSRNRFWVEGRMLDPDASLPAAYTTLVSPGFFEALGIPVVRGRALDERDRADAPFVGVINQSAARRFFAGEDPLGRRVKIGGPDAEAPWFEIVGVVADTRNRGLDQAPAPELFAARAQAGVGNQLFLAVRTAGSDPRALLPAVREVVREMDPDQPVYAIQTGEEIYRSQAAPRRATATFLTGFALFALLLAAVGIYAVVSYSVASRVREIGIRMALGAEAGRVRRLVVAQALVPVVVGAVVGLGLAVGVGASLEQVLFEVGHIDPLTYGTVTALLLTVALAATWIPALRASRLDPSETLRRD